jgi:hypothetical protein
VTTGGDDHLGGDRRAATGAAMIADPTLVVRLLVGADLSDGGIAIGRCADSRCSLGLAPGRAPSCRHSWLGPACLFDGSLSRMPRRHRRFSSDAPMARLCTHALLSSCSRSKTRISDGDR